MTPGTEPDLPCEFPVLLLLGDSFSGGFSFDLECSEWVLLVLCVECLSPEASLFFSTGDFTSFPSKLFISLLRPSSAFLGEDSSEFIGHMLPSFIRVSCCSRISFWNFKLAGMLKGPLPLYSESIFSTEKNNFLYNNMYSYWNLG